MIKTSPDIPREILNENKEDHVFGFLPNRKKNTCNYWLYPQEMDKRKKVYQDMCGI